MIQIIETFIKKYPYALMLCYWILYLIYFFLLEHFAIPSYILYSPLDDYIPFMELFMIPYAMWFPMLAISQGYFLFKHHKQEFQDLCFFMFSGMSIALLIYTILPNGLNLRVDVYPDNLLGQIVKLLQGFDTPSNVCPSIHVSSTLAIHIAVLRHKNFKHPNLVKWITSIVSILIILSTMFLKQHSIIDVIAAIVLTIILYPITYHMNWRKLFLRTPLKKIVQ